MAIQGEGGHKNPNLKTMWFVVDPRGKIIHFDMHARDFCEKGSLAKWNFYLFINLAARLL